MRRVAFAGLAALSMATSARAEAATQHLFIPQFASDAFTVALAFAFPALVAGAYLAAQRLHARLGRRTLIAMVGILVTGLGLAFAMSSGSEGIASLARLADPAR